MQLWERRSKFVRGDEQVKWEEVQPCMMSDEETCPDGRLARKRPCWRSDAFNNFMDELDSRADASLKQARKERVLFLSMENSISLMLSRLDDTY